MDAKREMGMLRTVHRLADVAQSPWMRRYMQDVSYLLNELNRNRMQCNKCCHEPGIEDNCEPRTKGEA